MPYSTVRDYEHHNYMSEWILTIVHTVSSYVAVCPKHSHPTLALVHMVTHMHMYTFTQNRKENINTDIYMNTPSSWRPLTKIDVK